MSTQRTKQRKILAPILLGIAFYLVILPIGLVMRLFRIDPMARRFDAQSASYRIASRQHDSEALERAR